MQIRELLRAAGEQGWLPDSVSLLEAAESPIVCLPFGTVMRGALDIPLFLAFPELGSGLKMLVWFSEEASGPWLRATLIEVLGPGEAGPRPCRKRAMWVRQGASNSVLGSAIGEVDPAAFEAAFTSDRPLVWEAHDAHPFKGMGACRLRDPNGPSLARPRREYGVSGFDIDDPISIVDGWNHQRRASRRGRGERHPFRQGEWEARASRERAAREREAHEREVREREAREQERAWRRRLRGPLPGSNSEDKF